MNRAKASLDEATDHFLEFLKLQQQAVPLNTLLDFLVDEGYARPSNLQSKRRSIMRRITGNPAFLLTGHTSNREIAYNEAYLEQQSVVNQVNEVLQLLLKQTIISGVENTLRIEQKDAILFNLGLEQLERDNVITRLDNNSIQWGSRSLFGYEPGVKRSTALSLPQRTWQSVEEIQHMLLDLSRGLAHVGSNFSEEPMIDIARHHVGLLNKSVVVELAIEHLRSTLVKKGYHNV